VIKIIVEGKRELEKGCYANDQLLQEDEIPAFTAKSYAAADLFAFSKQQFMSSSIGVGTLNPNSGADINTPNRLESSWRGTLLPKAFN
jgi:hypothetical protein